MEIIYLESMSEKQGIEVQYKQNYDITLPPMQGDRNSLKQVFLNLIKNASQAIEEKERLKFQQDGLPRHKLKGQRAISVDIKDNGKGIPRESLEKIFSPFYTTKKEGSGSGFIFSISDSSKTRRSYTCRKRIRTRYCI